MKYLCIRIFLAILGLSILSLIFTTIALTDTLNVKHKNVHTFLVLPTRLAYSDTILNNSTDQLEHVSPITRLMREYKPRTGEELHPTTVYYVLCGGKTLEFRHYLSFVSVIKNLQPDKVVFYLDKLPALDPLLYNTWYDEIKSDYPFLVVRKDPAACGKQGEVNKDFISSILVMRSGIYIKETVVLDALNSTDLRNQIVLRNPDESVAISIRQGISSELKNGSLRCLDSDEMLSDRTAPLCITVTKQIYPKDVFHLNTTFGALARKLFYGRSEMRWAEPNYDTLVENICHYVWIGGGNMDFFFYLSMLSSLYVQKADAVYIHGSAPSGRYWDLVKNNSAIRIIQRESPEGVYGNPAQRIAYVSDIVRADVMKIYGGIYLDVDAVFTQPIRHEFRGYDAMMISNILDSVFPIYINNGVMMGKPRTPFWNMYNEALRRYDENSNFPCLKIAYKIFERFPDSVKFDPRLQLLCATNQFKCCDIWANGGLNCVVAKKKFNWRRDVHVIQIAWPTPQEFTSPEQLLTLKGAKFTGVGLNVLIKAGVLDYFKSYLKPNQKAIDIADTSDIIN